MCDTPETPWVSRVESLYESSLRSVVYLGPERREVLFVRDDVAPVPEEVPDPGDRTPEVDALDGGSDAADGDLLCVARHFEATVELHFPVSEDGRAVIALDGPGLNLFDDPVRHLNSIVNGDA